MSELPGTSARAAYLDPQLSLLPGLPECTAPRKARSKGAAKPRSRRALPRSDLGGPEPEQDSPADLLAKVTRQLGSAATRPSLIRDRILAFLAHRPCGSAEVAMHIARPVPTTTGHLCAMIKRGLVRRMDTGVYALASYDGAAVACERRRSKSEPALRAALRELLERQQPLDALCAMTGKPAPVIQAVLREMWLSGVVIGTRDEGYQLVAAARKSETGRTHARRPKDTGSVRKLTA